MKKIIAIVTMLLAFTVSMSAQEKKISSQLAATKDITKLSAKIKDLNPTLKADLTTLMVSKHDGLSDPTLSEAEKANLSKHTLRKLMSGLSDAQRNELLKYPELVEELIH